MPIIRKAAVICDRCGATQEFDAGELEPLGVTATGPLKGWRRLKGDKCLCGGCAALYDELTARHEREVREFMGVKTVEFEI